MMVDTKLSKNTKPNALDKDGRNPKGRFAKGNSLSVGNNGGGSTARAKELKKILVEAVTDEDIREICEKMLSQAKAGDTHAVKELFDRIWGKAKQEVDFGENTVNSLVDILARMCGNGNGPS